MVLKKSESDDDLVEPLSPADARQLIHAIIQDGRLSYTQHALNRLEKRDMEVADVLNVLRGGFVQDTAFESGSYRYRFETPRMAVVVAFHSRCLARVVTAWRKDP